MKANIASDVLCEPLPADARCVDAALNLNLPPREEEKVVVVEFEPILTPNAGLAGGNDAQTWCALGNGARVMHNKDA